MSLDHIENDPVGLLGGSFLRGALALALALAALNTINLWRRGCKAQAPTGTRRMD